MTDYSFSHEDFEQMSWHDNHVHALRVIEGEYGGTLEFDLDYILEWLQDDDGRFLFRMIPSTLSFFEVANLRIDLGYQHPNAAVAPFSIHDIQRRLEERERYTATVWNMRFNWPEGQISFESPRFSQVGRGNPVEASEQRLEPAARRA